MDLESSVFNRYLIRITIPVVLILIILAAISTYNTKSLLVNSGKQKSELISDEIQRIFSQKEESLEQLEIQLETEMQRLSNRLVNYYFKDIDSLETINLDSIRAVMGVDTTQVDLYIINFEGVVVNTTMKSDQNLNLHSFGSEFSKFLNVRFNDNEFYCERFGKEIKTNKLKKYSYQKSYDGKYLIEIGYYSDNADKIITTFESRLDSISQLQPSILDVVLFVNDHNPLTLNNANSLSEFHRSVLRQTFRDKLNHTLIEFEDGLKFHYEYIYSADVNKGTEGDYGSVVRIKSNKSLEDEHLRIAFVRTLFVSSGLIVILILLILLNKRNNSKPIKTLTGQIQRFLEGYKILNIEVSGNREIQTLTDNINSLIHKVNESNNLLEGQGERIEKQKDLIKAKNEGVVDAMRYAKKIQSALFPSDSHVSKIFKNHLLYYKPKSIVSGDFYWIEEANEAKYFAVVDCTGHGVPGAFVSLVALNALNRAIREYKITDPSEILNKVNELTEVSLQQKEEEIKDGMEIALCVHFESTGKLLYSGAGSPIFIVRRSEHGNLIINNSWNEPEDDSTESRFLYEIKGNRRPVGGSDLKEEEYKTFEIEVKQTDRIYLYTDGLINQFGGKSGRKFKTRNLKKMILSIQEDELANQKNAISKTIEDWIAMGEESNEQIDDMCLIAVEISN